MTTLLILILLFKINYITSKQIVRQNKRYKNFTEVDELQEFVDIGYSFNENAVYWVGKTPFTVIGKQNADDKNNFVPFYASSDFSASQHGGTHLDAPYHFYEHGWKVADIPLTNLLVPGVLLDVRNESIDDAGFFIKPQHMIEWENKYGPIPSNSVLLINFGWASRWADRNLYLGLESNSDAKCHFPGISEEAAEWIVNSKKIVGVGVDTASVDVGATADFKVHQILALANIYNIENINFNINIELPVRGFDLIVMPMKVTDGNGAPCRVIAVPPKHITNVNIESSENVKNIVSNSGSYKYFEIICLFQFYFIYIVLNF